MRDELNSLLKANAEALGIPGHRAEVSKSGANLSWIRRILKDKKGVPDRIREILQSPDHSILS
jgi:hypothetical protein